MEKASGTTASGPTASGETGAGVTRGSGGADRRTARGTPAS